MGSLTSASTSDCGSASTSGTIPEDTTELEDTAPVTNPKITRYQSGILDESDGIGRLTTREERSDSEIQAHYPFTIALNQSFATEVDHDQVKGTVERTSPRSGMFRIGQLKTDE